MQNDLQDRYRGCLVGGAVGDALGNPVEFMSRQSILSQYGRDGITAYEINARTGNAVVTDDTQMTLFTAEGLLISEPGAETESVRKAYLEWLVTQKNARGAAVPGEWQGWLMEVPWLYARRAPGMTCLSALEAGGNGSAEHPLNNSKGCGGVMRTAPAGLYAETAEEAMRLGAEAAVLTHGHPLGYIPAGGLSFLVWLAARTDMPLDEAAVQMMNAAKEMFTSPREKEEMPVFTGLINTALRLAKMPEYPAAEAVSQIGEGWVGEEALAVAVYCAVRFADDFTACICAAVNHSGDSDSTGAVAGNLLGARLGLSAVPGQYTDMLEGVPELLRMADELYSIRNS